MFDSLKYSKKIENAGFERNQAEVLTNVLVEIMSDNLATQGDIFLLKQEISDFKKEVFSRFENLELKMTIKLGGMLIVAVGLIVTLQKVL